MKTAKIEKVKLSSLKPYWRNMNKGANVEFVKESISDFGYNSYIKIDDNNIIVAGHSRYRALLGLGHTEVDVIRLSGFSPNIIKKLRLVDNGIADINEMNLLKLENEINELLLIDKELKDDFSRFKSISYIFKDTTIDTTDTTDTTDTVFTKTEDIDNFTIKGKEVTFICPECLEEFKTII